MSSQVTVPDAIEPLIAWRAWALALDGSDVPELRPIVYAGERWPAREVARASCPPKRGGRHDPPDLHCTCGLYAVDQLDRLPAVNGRDVTVIGSVALWGRVLEHDAGFRAEFAYPRDLALVCGRCWELGRFTTNVVAALPTSRGTLIALCSEHASGPPGAGIQPDRLRADLLSAYAVDPVTDVTMRAIASSWSAPERRPRGGWWSRRMLFEAAAAAGFFLVFLGLLALAVVLR